MHDKKQHEVCAICGKFVTSAVYNRAPLTAENYNRKRGNSPDLLCRKCNKALGLFDNDPAVLTKAAKYLGDAVSRSAVAVGSLDVWDVDEKTGNRRLAFSCNNLLMKLWGEIATQCMALGNPAFKIAGMYIEYENVALPSNPATIPSYTRDDGMSYFTGLPITNDFLRVPLIATPVITIVPGYNTIFTAPQGNRATVYAQTAGVAGFLGRPFSDANNSKVFGATLVAMPVPSDQTKDIIFSRSYFPIANQKLKVAGSQIGISWNIDFL